MSLSTKMPLKKRAIRLLLLVCVFLFFSFLIILCFWVYTGWDGKLGSKGSYYQNGLPQECGLTVASSHSMNTIQSPKYNQKRKQRKRHLIDSDEENEDDTDNEDLYRQPMNICNSNRPTFPPRIDFPEIVVQNLERSMRSSSDCRSENNSTVVTEPPIKKQKLCNGRSKIKRKHQQQIYNQFNIASNNQYINNSLPLSVPFPGKFFHFFSWQVFVS